MSLDSAVRITTLVDEVAFRIERAILDGELAAGTELNQEQLCARLGVSRTPLREALRRLEAHGLVILRANRSAVVRLMGRQDVIDLYKVRAELESFACALACDNRSDADITELEEAQDQLEVVAADLRADLTDKGDAERQTRLHERLRESNDRFHRTIHRASGNTALPELIMQVWSRFPKDYVWRTLARVEDELALHSRQHRAVIDALRMRDAAVARAAMSQHIGLSCDLLVAHLDQQNFWGDSSVSSADQRGKVRA